MEDAHVARKNGSGEIDLTKESTQARRRFPLTCLTVELPRCWLLEARVTHVDPSSKPLDDRTAPIGMHNTLVLNQLHLERHARELVGDGNSSNIEHKCYTSAKTRDICTNS